MIRKLHKLDNGLWRTNFIFWSENEYVDLTKEQVDDYQLAFETEITKEIDDQIIEELLKIKDNL